MAARRIIDHLVQSRTHDIEIHQVLAKVTRSDDLNNVCDIQYVDEGKLCKRKNIAVRIYGNGMDWFPVENEIVVVQIGRQTCEIISRYVSNFGADMLPSMKLTQDIYSDQVGGPVGSFCFGI